MSSPVKSLGRLDYYMLQIYIETIHLGYMAEYCKSRGITYVFSKREVLLFSNHRRTHIGRLVHILASHINEEAVLVGVHAYRRRFVFNQFVVTVSGSGVNVNSKLRA